MSTTPAKSLYLLSVGLPVTSVMATSRWPLLRYSRNFEATPCENENTKIHEIDAFIHNNVFQQSDHSSVQIMERIRIHRRNNLPWVPPRSNVLVCSIATVSHDVTARAPCYFRFLTRAEDQPISDHWTKRGKNHALIAQNPEAKSKRWECRPGGALPIWESVGMRRGFAPPHFRHLDDPPPPPPPNLTLSTILFRSCWVPFRSPPFSACRRSFCLQIWPNLSFYSDLVGSHFELRAVHPYWFWPGVPPIMPIMQLWIPI